MQSLWIGDSYYREMRELLPHEARFLKKRLLWMRKVGICSIASLPMLFLVFGLGSYLGAPDFITLSGLWLLPVSGLLNLTLLRYLSELVRDLETDLWKGEVLRFQNVRLDESDPSAWLEVLPNSRVAISIAGEALHRIRQTQIVVAQSPTPVPSDDGFMPKQLEMNPIDGQAAPIRTLSGQERVELESLAGEYGNDGALGFVLAIAGSILVFFVIWSNEWPIYLHLIETPMFALGGLLLWRTIVLKRESLKLKRDLEIGYVKRIPTGERYEGRTLYLEWLPNSGAIWNYCDVPGPIRRVGVITY